MQAGLTGAEYKGFLGVNLRKDRMNLADEELAKAINADLHSKIGSIVLRLGRTKQFTTALSSTAIRRLAKINGYRYQVAGTTLFRDQTSILTGLSSNLITTLLPYRPLNDATTWAFIADDALMRKDNGSVTRKWGLATTSIPDITVSIGCGTALTGTYSVKITEARYSGTSNAHESNPSSASSDISLTSNTLAIGNITLPTDAQINRLRIYRTAAGGTSWLFDSAVEIPTTSDYGITFDWEVSALSSTTLILNWSYNTGSISVSGSTAAARGSQSWAPTSSASSEDASGRRGTHLWEISLGYVTTQTNKWAFHSSKADSALGTAVETDNDPPPEASWAFEYGGCVFLCRDADNPHYLWYSKRFRPESFPTDQFLEIGSPDDPLQCGVAHAGLAGVFTRRNKHRILGNTISGFVATEAMSRRGTPAPLAVVAGEHGVIFPARDGVFSTNFVAPDTELSKEIHPLFIGDTVNEMSPINWDAVTTMAGATWKNRYYLAYPSGSNTSPDRIAVLSFDTGKWYFYDHPMRALLVEEDVDQLVGGSADGFVYILEDGSSDAESDISLDVETKNYYGESTITKKLFFYFKVKADTDSATLSVKFYIDDELVRTVSLTSSNAGALLRLPEGAMGSTWKVKITYTGQRRPSISGVQALWLPLGAA